MADTSPTVLEAALAAAGRGWRVFPLRPGDKRPAFPDHTASACTGRDSRCRDGHQGWESRASTDRHAIRRAWSATAFNVAVACGPSGLVVVDLDVPKHPGDVPPEALAAEGIGTGEDMFAVVCARAGQAWPPRTFTVATAGGGRHLYFTAPAQPPGNTTGRLGWKIDTRGIGGYVVGAGSTIAGRPYTIVDDTDVAPLPDWLAALLQPAAPPARPTAVPVLASDARRSAYLRAAVARETARVTSAPPGTRNTALYLASVALGQLVAGGALSEYEVTAWLSACAAQGGQKPTEIDKTIASGLRAGARRPRSVAA